MRTSDFIGHGHSIEVSIPNTLNAINDLSRYHPSIGSRYSVRTKFKYPHDERIVIMRADWGLTAESIISKLVLKLRSSGAGNEFLIDENIHQRLIGANQWELMSWRLDKVSNYEAQDGIRYPSVIKDTLTWKPTVTPALRKFISDIESEDFTGKSRDRKATKIIEDINTLKESVLPITTTWTWIHNK